MNGSSISFRNTDDKALKKTPHVIRKHDKSLCKLTTHTHAHTFFSYKNGGGGGGYYEETRPANHLRDFEFSLVLGKVFRSDTIIYFKAAGGGGGGGGGSEDIQRNDHSPTLSLAPHLLQTWCFKLSYVKFSWCLLCRAAFVKHNLHIWFQTFSTWFRRKHISVERDMARTGQGGGAYRKTTRQTDGRPPPPPPSVGGEGGLLLRRREREKESEDGETGGNREIERGRRGGGGRWRRAGGGGGTERERE